MKTETLVNEAEEIFHSTSPKSDITISPSTHET